MSQIVSSELRGFIAAEKIVDVETLKAEAMLKQVELSIFKAFKHLANVIVMFAVTFQFGEDNHLPTNAHQC